ncbi:beta-ketoacyl-ACP synthase 3 [Streptomyces sp. NRRL B-1347]|uniref:beta-ketoacyl-ACP synthase 3 n=1 Tax=Streptomyces sp. NRRL B-1347 TaxID=1476877 RepID=UPI0004C81C5E|nr:beta-ketoacyl-ACP synthase 3 [Streptomyces sp. NRRL B-1347]
MTLTGSGSLKSGSSIACRITGLGGYRPRQVVDSREVAQRLGIAPEWITSRTGIESRRRAGSDEPLVEMSVMASELALKDGQVDPVRVDCVVLATATNPQQLPAIAPRVAAALGAANAAAWDINAACAGFCHGLEIVRGLVSSGAARCALVIGADRMLDVVDPMDRNTAPLFADGAGAAVLEQSAKCGVGPAVWGCDGHQADALEIRPPFTGRPDNHGVSAPYLRLKGTTVARWAAGTVPDVARRALDAAGVGWKDIGAFVPHQANQRLTELILERLGAPRGIVVAQDVRTAGNTGGASVPLALWELASSGRVRHGDLALLLGFGAGFSFAGQVVRIP